MKQTSLQHMECMVVVTSLRETAEELERLMDDIENGKPIDVGDPSFEIGTVRDACKSLQRLASIIEHRDKHQETGEE